VIFVFKKMWGALLILTLRKDESSEHVQYEAFFTLWTMKEAIVKALGFGLTGIEAITGKDFDELNIDSVWQIQFREGLQGAVATTEKWEHLKYYRLKE